MLGKISSVFLIFLLELTFIAVQGCTVTKLTPIGTDPSGFTYHYDTTGGWDFASAKAECECHGMRLATITTDLGFNYLAEKSSVDFNGWFWTSGRDSQTIGQFSWDNFNTRPISFKLLNLNMDSFETCLFFYSIGKKSYLSPQPCSKMRDGAGILCYTTTP